MTAERLRWREVWAYRRHSEGKVGKYREHCAQWPGVLAALVKHAQVKAHDDLGAVPPLHVLFRSDDIWSALWLHQMSNMLFFFLYNTDKVGFLLLFFPILTWNTEGCWRNLQELLWVLVKQLVNHTCFCFFSPLSALRYSGHSLLAVVSDSFWKEDSGLRWHTGKSLKSC